MSQPIESSRPIELYNNFGDKPKMFFDSASIGLESVTADEASIPVSRLDWDGLVEQAAQSVARLLNQAPAYVTFFHNTTAGVQRIFLRLSHLFGSSFPTLLTTDLEYPGIVALVDENWNGRIVMTRLADLINKGQSALVPEVLRQSVLAARPSVVYLSHVGRSNGYRIDESIVRYIKEVDPRTVIVIDGAQACGNIRVDSEFLEDIDFYVTSGHKWLCAKPTLGIVYARSSWDLKDPAQSYSKTRASTGTGNSSALQSLKKALEDLNGESATKSAAERMQEIELHNSQLAEYFSTELDRRCRLTSVGAVNMVVSGQWRWNGIVSINLPSEKMVDLLQNESENKATKFTVLKGESWRDKVGGDPQGERYLLDCAATEVEEFFSPVIFQDEPIPGTGPFWSRFCFHYYHTKEDVDALLERIEDAMKN